MDDTHDRSLSIEAVQAALAGQYRVERLLGYGGMGAVFLAHDITLDRAVAIKVIRADVVATAGVRERFLQEARLVARLRHPHIVAVYSAGEFQGQLWFAMEYVAGGSLREQLDRDTQWGSARVSQLLFELAHALDYAHRAGIVHRDIKPENILIDEHSGRAMITDFGVARALTVDSNLTGAGFILGSPRYMSPEQASGDPSLDGRSDLYSLALVGFECVTGKPVIDAPTASGALMKQLTEVAPPLKAVAPAADDALARTIDGALAKDPTQRWPDGRTMALALNDALIAEGTTSGSYAHDVARGISSASNPAMRRAHVGAWWRQRVALVVAVVIAAVGLFGATWWWKDKAPTGRGMVVMPFDVQGAPAEWHWLRDGAVSMLTMSLAQWQDLPVTEYERTLDLVRDAGIDDRARVSLEQARKIGRDIGAADVVMGQVVAIRDSLLITARSYAVHDGAARQQVSRTIPITSDPRAAFDAITAALLQLDANSTGAPADLARTTTSSLAAYRAYVAGVRALHHWDLEVADSLLTEAVQLDTTFALAYHYRALTRGWNGGGRETRPTSDDLAFRYASRLPESWRLRVEGHLALANGLRVSGMAALPELDRALQLYTRTVQTDSMSAASWYGLGDAAYHLTMQAGDTSVRAAWTATSIRAFERSLQLDPGLGLSYMHLVDMFAGHAGTLGLRVLRGDSAVDIATIPDSMEIKRLRDIALTRALNMAEAWTVAEPRADQAWTALSNALATGNRPDSAAAVMRTAVANGARGGKVLYLTASFFEFRTDVAMATRRLAEVLPDIPDSAIAPLSTDRRRSFMGMAASLAAAGNDPRLLDSVLAKWGRAELQSTTTTTATPSKEFAATFAWIRPALRWGMGITPTDAERDALMAAIRRVDISLPSRDPALRSTAESVGYMLYMQTQDPSIGQWVLSADPGNPFVELKASLALQRGDTATARKLAETFTVPALVRQRPLAWAGMRTYLRAEVLVALGDTTQAIQQLEATDPSRFNLTMVNPGMALWVRSDVRRGQLYEARGDKPNARAAYARFLSRWPTDDPLTRAVRSEAERGLQRVSGRS